MDPPRFVDAKDFYENMTNRVLVKFIPKVEGKTFDLQLNKKMTYDQVREALVNICEWRAASDWDWCTDMSESG